MDLESFYLRLLVWKMTCLALGNAAIISSNIERSCPGELVTITCITVGNSQRWRIFSGSSLDSEKQSPQLLIEKTFRREEVPGTTVKLVDSGRNLYTFILISTLYQEFISTVSVVSSSALDNTQLECAATTRSMTRIETAAIPGSPHNLVYTSIGQNQSMIFSWDYSFELSRVDYFQYSFEQFLASKVTYSVMNITTDRSVSFLDLSYSDNFTFTVTANNCVGESMPIGITTDCRSLNLSAHHNIVFLNASFNQALGTVLHFLCTGATVNDSVIQITTCEDGQWTPYPTEDQCNDILASSLMIQKYYTSSDYSMLGKSKYITFHKSSVMPMTAFSTLSNTTTGRNSNNSSVIYILSSLVCILVMILVTAFIVIYQLKYCQKQIQSTVPTTAAVSMYETEDPIYESISEEDFRHGAKRSTATVVEMCENSAYCSNTSCQVLAITNCNTIVDTLQIDGGDDDPNNIRVILNEAYTSSIQCHICKPERINNNSSALPRCHTWSNIGCLSHPFPKKSQLLHSNSPLRDQHVTGARRRSLPTYFN